MGDRDQLLSEFIAITDADHERARFYLESSAWQLEVALASFYETDGDGEDLAQVDDAEPEIVQEIAPLPQPEQPVSTKTNASKPKPSRFGTVASLAKDAGSSDEEEGQAFYAGGSEHSGQQVLGPGKKKDFFSEMFKSVQEHGGEVVDPRNQIPSRRSNTFAGTGYRLGQTSNDTETVSNRTPADLQPIEATLKLWKEGFSVDDGPIRDYTDPNNKHFLDHIRRGEIPSELVSGVRGSEVHLNMEDHRNEQFVPTRTKLKAFAGQGHLLGSPAPTTQSDLLPSSAASSGTSLAESESKAKSSIPVDTASPTTTIQIRLADGSRLGATLNHTHTVADIRRYIVTARPQYENRSFSLLTSFPSRELTEDSQTLASAGVLNSALMQRLT